jgi:hypothetical protein
MCVLIDKRMSHPCQIFFRFFPDLFDHDSQAASGLFKSTRSNAAGRTTNRFAKVKVQNLRTDSNWSLRRSVQAPGWGNIHQLIRIICATATVLPPSIRLPFESSISNHRLPITILHIAYALPVVQLAPPHSRPGFAALVPSFVGLFVSSTPNATLAAPLPRSGGSSLGSSPNRLITTSSSLSALLAALSGTVLSADLAALACVVRLALLLALARFGDG